MTVFDNYFPLGLGTTRLPISSSNDLQGIEKSAELIVNAIERGVNYIDTSYTYSYGKAPTAINMALKNTNKPVSVTLKSMYNYDKTDEDLRNRVFFQLKELDLAQSDFLVFWNITSYEMFQNIIRKGGVYDSALKLKDEHIINSICCSLHIPPCDIVKIVESGAFEGITISYNLLNAPSMQIVLDTAQKHGVGVAVMNPLGGGLIPQNPDFFSYSRFADETTTESALRFVKANPAVKIVLSGANNKDELEENISVLSTQSKESGSVRLQRVLASGNEISDICTGCNYCSGCPENIPISTIMQARNRLLFDSNSEYNRQDSELCRNINLFYRCDYIPETNESPCIKCRMCEKKCTQKLEIINGIMDFYERAEKCGYSLSARINRVKSIFENKNYSKIGLYPNGGFADLVINLHQDIFKESYLEWIYFNSNSSLHGQFINNIKICSPQEISMIKPDAIIVCSYKFQDDIYNDLEKYENDGIEIIKLHEENDVPWVW